MNLDVKRSIAELDRMTPGELRERYQELFGQESRSGNRQWLYRRCAWRIQALAEGSLPERARRRAQAIANDADIRTIPPKTPTPDPNAPRRSIRMSADHDPRLPLPGAVLNRPFKGRMHVVTVQSDGFEYAGQRYNSLSAVAHAITGSHWNGFNFFRKQLIVSKSAVARSDQ